MLASGAQQHLPIDNRWTSFPGSQSSISSALRHIPRIVLKEPAEHSARVACCNIRGEMKEKQPQSFKETKTLSSSSMNAVE